MISKERRKIAFEAFSQLEELATKHGVKLVGSWGVSAEHLNVHVFDAPSFEVFRELSREPVRRKWTSYTTSEIKVAKPFEEILQLIKQDLE